MKKFLNLSVQDSKSLDVPLYKNALSLKQDAKYIAENRNSYSSATSLLVLSTEEAIKSILVFLHAENCNIYKIKDAKKFFSDHVMRHHIAMLIEVGLGIYESYELYYNRKPTTLLKTKYNWLNTFLNGALDIVNSIDPFIKTEENVEYLQQFNLIKNKGFYVDYQNGLIDPQTEVTIEDYKKALIILDRIMKFSKLIRILFHEKLVNHMGKQEIDRKRKIIKNFIDEGLNVVDFKELRKNM